MSSSRRIHILTYAVVLLGYGAGLFLDIQEIDAAQYATMSRDMLQSGDFLHLYDRGRDYLDKPPLTFWFSALSYAVFGVNTFAYKLPSVLFSLLAIYSLQRLARLLYGERTAAWAGLILASCQAFFLMNNDVKTDMYLIGSMCLAVWQLTEYARGGKWWHIQLGFLGMGMAMLAKGPLGLVAPILALGGDWLLRRDWKAIFKWQWLTGIPILVLVLLPFMIGQYEQYGWSGVEFFLWTQSFGRVTGASEWANDATPFFFVHTMAWSFLPWTLLFLVALGKRLVETVKFRFRFPDGEEAISLSGFVLIFAALSLSRFKLPHYIFVTYPFAALLTARLVDELIHTKVWVKLRNGLMWTHIGLYQLVFLAVAALCVWAFPEATWWVKGPLLAAALALAVAMLRVPSIEARYLLATATGFALLNLIVNVVLYPQLLQYQSAAMAGKYIAANEIPQERLFAYQVAGRAMDFYSGQVMKNLPDRETVIAEAQKSEIIVYTSDKGKDELTGSGFKCVVLEEFPHFKVNRLTFPFLDPNKRPGVLGQRFLLRVNLP